MSEVNVKNKVISSLGWKLLERLFVQGVQFVIQIILARLLFPSDYGVIAIINIFISIANSLIQSGFSTSLIQKKDTDDIDFSSIFYLNLVTSTIIYILFYIAAPYIATMYQNEIITPVLRILSLTLFSGAINSVQSAIISKKLDFRKSFISNIGAMLISGIIGIFMAKNGYGVWALVAQQLSSSVATTIVLWFVVKWRPKLVFSFKRVKTLFSFGWKLLVSSLIETIYQDIYGLIIGKKYDNTTLGYYTKGQQFPYYIINTVNSSITSVMLPALSLKQNNKEELKKMLRRSIVTSCFIIFPMMVGLASIAKPLISIILTDKWLECVPFLQMMCFAYAFNPFHIANLQAINAVGRSDIYLKLEIIKKIIGITAIIITIPFGVYAMVATKLVTSIISSFLNASPNKKLLNYSYFEQIKDIFPSIALSLTMGIIVYLISFLNIDIYLRLIIQITSGIVIYIGIAKLLKLECYTYLENILKDIINKKLRRAK